MKSMTTINWTYSMPRRSMTAFAIPTQRHPLSHMLLRFPTPSAWGPGKWGAFALALLVPGSFVVLPVLWLVGELKGAAMNNREAPCIAVPRSKSESVAQRLRRWWRSQDPSERYLAEASSHADLERRMRVLERGSDGPAFVTFNH
jgi:hypothetical protein